MVNTNLDKAEIHRQPEYKNPQVDYASAKRQQHYIPHTAVEAGVGATEVAQAIFDSIEKDEFYVFPQPNLKTMIAQKFGLILQKNLPLDLSRAI